MIKAKCACGAKYTVKPEYAGRKVTCKKCGQKFQVPDEIQDTQPYQPPAVIEKSQASEIFAHVATTASKIGASVKPAIYYLIEKRRLAVEAKRARQAELAELEQLPKKALCPFCEEEILASARKCKHCGEYLDERYAPQPQAPQVIYQQPQQAPSVNVSVNQSVTVPGRPRWSRGVAVLLSLLIPGLGQMYKGQVINGIFWFVVTVTGYILIIPGMVLHVCCVLGAASGDPYR
jgi:TM2 domain-containing membrane protein YozV/transcription elongation factor Elf1